MRNVSYSILFLALVCRSGVATSWSWSLSGSDLPSGTGNFSACEGTTHTKITGNYVRAATGLIHMSSAGCSNGCNAGCGSCTNASVTTGSCASLPTDIYGMEVPGVHFIVQPVLSNAAATETQPIYNIVQDTGCPVSGTSTMNFVFSQWISGTDNTSQNTQTTAGTFTWNANTNTATVTGRYNITALTPQNANYTYPNSGCSGGMIPTTGPAGTDRHGTIYISNQAEFFYQTDTGHAIFGVKQAAINNVSELRGTYSGIAFDASGSNTVIPIVNMYLDPATGSMTGYKMLSDTSWDTSTMLKFSITDMNIPVSGMMHGTLSDGSNTGNFVCVVEVGLHNYNSLLCSGQKPSNPAIPYTLLLASVNGYSLANLRGNWDSEFAVQNGGIFGDESGNGNACTLNSGVSWTGSGTSASPYAIAFTSSNSGADFGSAAVNSQTHLMFDTWVSPAAAGSGDKVILGDSSDGVGKGFTLRQSKSQAGKVELVVGKSYQDVVLADSPLSYWRLGESGGTVAKDIVGANDGTYSVATSGTTGALANDSDLAAIFNGTSTGVIAAMPTTQTDNYTLEAWVNPPNTNAFGYLINNGNPSCSGYGLFINNLMVSVQYGCVVTFYNTAAVSPNVWNHLVLVRSSGTTSLWVNGVQYGLGASGPITPSPSFYIGRDTTGDYFTGLIDEVAVYGTPLSSTSIANHYNAGLGTYGGICYSTSVFSNGMWSFLGGIYDGTNLSLIVNGRSECQVAAPAGYFTAPATDLMAGSTAAGSNSWQGQIADIKVYGTSDGSSAGTAANLKTNFDASADRFRSTPVGNLVTNGLVYSFDPANSVRGLQSPASGCAVTSVFDLSPTAIASTLVGFTSCSTYGWQGDGSAPNPNVLVMDGQNDMVRIPYNVALGGTITLTEAAWVKTTDGSDPIIISVGTGWGTQLTLDQWGRTQCYTSQNGNYVFGAFGGAMNDGNWHYIACALDGATMYTFADGQLQGSVSAVAQTWTVDAQLGAQCDGADSTSCYNNYTGSLGTAQIYGRSLGAAEISQNCKAQQSRYPGAVCH